MYAKTINDKPKTINDKQTILDFTNEIIFQTTRSGGKGGQNVNKVETKIELDFDVNSSPLLSDDEKIRILAKLQNRIDKNGILRIVSQTERSQYLNKQKAINKFYELIERALRKEKVRKKTKPSAVIKENRLSLKKSISQKKQLRKIKSNEIYD